MAVISPEKALALVEHLSEDQLRASVSDAFFGGKRIATGTRGDDQIEDLYLALLETARRLTVIEGCGYVFSQLAPLLFTQDPILNEAQNQALQHLMATIDIAHPAELKGQTQSLLQLVLDPKIPDSIRLPIVRAALGYARNEDDARFWEPMISEDLIPGYAFKALFQINPNASRIVYYLVKLWVRKLNGKLTLNVASLTADANDESEKGEHLIAQVIKLVCLAAPTKKALLQKELVRFPWSRAWVRYISLKQEPPIIELGVLRMRSNVQALKTNIEVLSELMSETTALFRIKKGSKYRLAISSNNSNILGADSTAIHDMKVSAVLKSTELLQNQFSRHSKGNPYLTTSRGSGSLPSQVKSYTGLTTFHPPRLTHYV